MLKAFSKYWLPEWAAESSVQRNFLLVVFSLALVLTGVLSAQTASPTPSGLDSIPLKIGLLGDRDTKLIRFQALQGDWLFILEPMPPDNATGPLLSQETRYTLPQGEDATLEVSRLGILFRTSSSEEFPGVFARFQIKGGDLINLEIPYVEPKTFQGSLEVILNNKTMRLTNTIPLHSLVTSSVSITAPTTEPEAVRAHVIAARTLAAFAKLSGRHASDAVDLCDSPHCLAYNGCANDRELVDLLTIRTRNEVMTYQGKLFLPYFHPTCGGKTSLSRDIFGVSDPIHQAKEDKSDVKSQENCFHSPSYEWTREFTTTEMLDFVALEFAAGAERFFDGWQAVASDSSGRVTRVKLYGRKEKSVPGVDFLRFMQRHFGPLALRSQRFSVIPMKRSVIFKGSGEGHGVGMCHWGADGLAKKGWDFRKILSFYYNGITIEPGTNLLPTVTPEALSSSAPAAAAAPSAGQERKPPRKPRRPRSP